MLFACQPSFFPFGPAAATSQTGNCQDELLPPRCHPWLSLSCSDRTRTSSLHLIEHPQPLQTGLSGSVCTSLHSRPGNAYPSRTTGSRPGMLVMRLEHDRPRHCFELTLPVQLDRGNPVPCRQSRVGLYPRPGASTTELKPRLIHHSHAAHEPHPILAPQATHTSRFAPLSAAGISTSKCNRITWHLLRSSRNHHTHLHHTHRSLRDACGVLHPVRPTHTAAVS